MPLDLFTAITPPALQNPNFARVVSDEDDAVRAVIRDWAEGFVDRDGKFVGEFQRTFNSCFWELYLFAVLKSCGIRVDFSFDAPDFVAPDDRFAIEAVIASHAQNGKPEWEKRLGDLTHMNIGDRYLQTLARLSNSFDAKLRRYRERYVDLPHMEGLGYVIGIHNFCTPDAQQLGDVAMQRLLFDVWEENAFQKEGGVELPTGLFLDDRASEVSAVLYSSLATFGKARALSDSKGSFVFQAVRIRNNNELIPIGALKADYQESLCDGLRLFHNPYAKRPLRSHVLDEPDMRKFRVVDGELWTSCHPDGDLCARQVHHLKRKVPV
jgi:hypothetical protein